MVRGLLAWCLLFLCSQSGFSQFDERVKIDNDWTRVLVVRSEPGEKSQVHEHKINRVMVYLDPGKMTLTSTSGKVENLHFKANEVLWSPISGPHVSHNLSEKPVGIVEIELKDRPRTGAPQKTGPLDWVKADPKRYQVELENDQVRVVRVRYGVGEKGVPHEHPYSFVVAYLTPGKMSITPEGRSPINISFTRGMVKFGKPGKHVEENSGDSPLEMVVVEFKE